jgi:WD40 repeat protein
VKSIACRGAGNIGGTRAVRFTPDGKQFAAWGDDLWVYVWEVATGKAVQEFRAQPKEVPPDTKTENGIVGGLQGLDRLSGGCFSADAGTLFMMMNRVYRFSIKSGEELPNIETGGGVFSVVAPSPDDRFALVTSHGPQQQIHQPDGSVRNQPATTHNVQLWNLAENKVASVYESPGSFADRIAFSRDGNKVAMTVVGQHPRAEIRKIPDLAPDIEFELPSRAAGVEFSASGKRLAISIADGTVLIFDLEKLPHP